MVASTVLLDACQDIGGSDTEEADLSLSDSSSDFSDGPGASGPVDKPRPECGELLVLQPFAEHLPTLSEILRSVRRKVRRKSGQNSGPEKTASTATAAGAQARRGKSKDARQTKLCRRASRKRPFATYKTSGSVKAAIVERGSFLDLNPSRADGDLPGDYQRPDIPSDIVYAPSVSDVSSDCLSDDSGPPTKMKVLQRVRDLTRRADNTVANDKARGNSDGQTCSSSLSSNTNSSCSEATDIEPDIEDTRAELLARLHLNPVCTLGSARCNHVTLCTYQGSYINHAVAKFFPKDSPRFDAELEALRRLRHKNILRMIDARSFSTQRVIVLRYCNKGNLAAHIGKLSLVQIVNYFLKVSGALSYMHGKSFIHGDVKLENILLDMIGEPLLSDLDLSERLAPGESQIHGRRGTEGFIAPEMYADPTGSYNGYKVRS